MRKILPSLLILALLTSCSSIRMRYHADVAADDGRSGTFELEKSYDLKSTPVFCGLTAIFFGGMCWYYVIMPTTGQKEMIRRAAEARLDALFADTEYETSDEEIDSDGWKDQPVKEEYKARTEASPEVDTD